MRNNDDWDGQCPIPQVFVYDAQEDIAIYDHEGNAFVRPKIKLGFDLTVRSSNEKQTKLRNRKRGTA